MLSHMHPQLAAFFQYRLAQQELMQQLDGTDATLPMSDLRALRGWYRLFGQRVGGPILDMAEVQDLTADTDERPIRLRHYRPHTGSATPSAFPAMPAIVYFHGGGWSMGDLDTHDRVCRRLAQATQAVVIAVDYALAPELPWPQAPHDAIAATRWILQNANTLSIDAHRVGVAGDSAGGNLAAVVALALRTPPDISTPANAAPRTGTNPRDNDKQEAPATLPPLACQILIYPATDLRSGFDPHYPSLHDNAQRPPLTTAQMCEHMRIYLDDREESAHHPLASPLVAPAHRGAAPALIITAGLDPLRDDGAAYAQKLSSAGVDMLHRHYAGFTHGFIEMAAILDCLPETFALMAQWFRECTGHDCINSKPTMKSL